MSSKQKPKTHNSPLKTQNLTNFIIMPFAATHVLFAIILTDFYRDHFVEHRKMWPTKFILAAGIGGLLPDLDIPVAWVLQLFTGTDYLFLHKNFTHSLLFFAIFLVPAIIFLLKFGRHSHYFKFPFMVSIGILIHLGLDIIAATVPLFWPLALRYGINISDDILIFAGIDALLLLAWLWHEEKTHRISDFL